VREKRKRSSRCRSHHSASKTGMNKGFVAARAGSKSIMACKISQFITQLIVVGNKKTKPREWARL